MLNKYNLINEINQVNMNERLMRSNDIFVDENI